MVALYGDLSRDDARHLRRHPVDARRGQAASSRFPISPACRKTERARWPSFFAMLMFSLAGIPPLAGFFAKWYVFNAAIQAHLYWLAVIGVLSSAVARLLLSAHRQDHVFRRAGASFRQAGPRPARRAGGGCASSCCCSVPIRRLLSKPRRPRPSRCFDPSRIFSMAGIPLSHLEAALRSLAFGCRFDALARPMTRLCKPGEIGRSRPALDRRRASRRGAGGVSAASGARRPAISTPACC